MISFGLNLVKLTKPKIMLLVLAAGTSVLMSEDSVLIDPDKFVIFLLGPLLTGGCTNAMNQYFERELDLPHAV